MRHKLVYTEYKLGSKQREYLHGLHSASEAGLVLIRLSKSKHGYQYMLKIRQSNEVLEKFNDVFKAQKLIKKHSYTGGLYKAFFDKIKEYQIQSAIVEWSFDDVTITWGNNKWFVKHKGGTAQPMGTKRLAELGYLQHIVEQGIKSQIKSRFVWVDLKEDGYKPVSNVKKGYYINKYGDVIRKVSEGYKYCNIVRMFRAKDDDNSYVSVDIDKEINKLFWS